MRLTSCGRGDLGPATSHEKGPKDPLEDHANAMEQLAQTAFRQVAGVERKHLVHNAFFRSINDLDLQCYWLAA